jgi:polysaccharide deacetylase 2 family uncharacterized protein YibQ
MIAAIRENNPKREKIPGMEYGSDAVMKFQDRLAGKFTALEVRESDYSFGYFPKDSTVVCSVAVPRGRPMEWIIWEFKSAAAGTPFRAADCVCATQTRCEITFRSTDARHPRVVLRIRQSNRYTSNTAKMAILIENFGFEANQTTMEYLAFPEPLTVSLLPTQKLATWTAQIADEYKKEIVLALPMEPLPPQFSGYRGSMVMITHDREQIRNLLARAEAAIPNFSGVSNFHGNGNRGVMEDSRAMGIILNELKRHRRSPYFIYTDEQKRSVAPRLMKTEKVPGMQIQRTIGANLTTEQVRARLSNAAAAAQKTGSILIKAQPSQAFISVLKEEMEMLKQNGIRLVYVSELVKY